MDRIHWDFEKPVLLHNPCTICISCALLLDYLAHGCWQLSRRTTEKQMQREKLSLSFPSFGTLGRPLLKGTLQASQVVPSTENKKGNGIYPS